MSYPTQSGYPTPNATDFRIQQSGYPSTGYPGAGGQGAPQGYHNTTGYPSGYPSATPQGGTPGEYPGGYQPAGVPAGYPSTAPQGGTPGGYPGGYQPAGYPSTAPQGGTPGGYPGGYQPAGAPAGYPSAAPQGGTPGGYPGGYQPAGAPAGYPSTASQGGTLGGYTYPQGTGYHMQGQPSGYPMMQNPGITGGPPPSKNSTKVELSIKCRNLIDRDFTSKSDPTVALFMFYGTQWIEKGRTENIKNSHNPDFSTRILVDYLFEESQKIRFDVYDLDNKTSSLKDDDFLGRLECTLGQIVSSSPFTKPLLSRKGLKQNRSSITVFAEELEETGSREVLEIAFKATHLDNKDFMGKSDPFLEIQKPSIDGSWQLVHRTEVIKNNLNPHFKPFSVQQRAIGGSNPNTQILVTCFDKDGDGSHDLIGECRFTVGELLEGQSSQKAWPLINAKKQKKKGKSYKNSGELILNFCKVTRSYSFLDYILGGTQINMVVAVDFTASNGDPRDPNSLHFMSGSQPNEYIRAIQSVGHIVQDYDSDKMFPALGFGAKIPPDFRPSFEFALNFDMSNPFCAGVQGLVSAYQNCLMQVRLYGPTNFEPVIRHCIRFAETSHHQPTAENYYVLLILTDGEISDLAQTTEAIVYASSLPMSIIMVGVGNERFEKMIFLDGDGGPLRAPSGRTALRDIVQFVPFSKFLNLDPSLLAREVLAEVPMQLTEYYRHRNIQPKPKKMNTAEVID